MRTRTLIANARRRGDGDIELRSPGVGIWRGAPRPGALVLERGSIGRLDVLGSAYDLIAPGAGIVRELPGGTEVARAVEYGQVLVVLSLEGPSRGVVPDIAASAQDPAAGGLRLRSPLGGRYYGRPGPGKPAFLQVGDTVSQGQTVCLLEVMKTYSRVTFSGDDLPPAARVGRIVPGDGDDLNAGDIILELEPDLR